MRSFNSHALNTRDQIENTLITLLNLGLARVTKNIKTNSSKNDMILTWDNHISGRHNSGKSFNTIQQYVSIYETGAYHAILHDGSILRAFFRFEKNMLTQQSLLYWPAPVEMPEEDVETIGIRQALEENICNNCSESHIQMRSPVRLDFDPANSRIDHPETHIHMQHCDCRMKVKSPVCFNTFVKFIFKNFYPNIDLSFLKTLHPLHYSGHSRDEDYILTI